MYDFTAHSLSKFFKPSMMFLSVALLATACTSTPKNKAHQDWHPGVSVKNGVPNRYQVRAGDSISQIAYRYGLDWRELSKLNKLDANHTIYIGQWLTLWESSAKVYEVQPSVEVAVAKKADNQKIINNPIPNIKQPVPAVQPTLQQSPIIAQLSPKSFISPLSNARLYKQFGEQGDGIWLSAPAGTPVVATRSGVVSYPKKGDNTTPLAVIIQHDDDYTSTYVHLQEVRVFEGQVVNAGDMIGTVGTQSLLDFHLLQKGRAINPVPLLR